MSNYTDYAIHPMKGIIMPCEMLDDHFGAHEYGVRFYTRVAENDGILGSELQWDVPLEMEVYRPDQLEFVSADRAKAAGVYFEASKTIPLPEQEKSADDGDTNVTNKKSDTSAVTAEKKDFCVDEDTIFWAFRYALGRRTGAVMHMVGIIKKNWQLLQFHTQEQMKEEITKAINDGLAGDDCDVESWQEILKLKGNANVQANS